MWVLICVAVRSKAGSVPAIYTPLQGCLGLIPACSSSEETKGPHVKEMLLLITLLLLAAVPDSSLGEEEEEEEEEEETEEETPSGVAKKTQQEIVDKHNEIRRSVKPSASNMLKVVWDESIGERARKWAEQCKRGMSSKEDRIINETFCGEITFQSNYVNSWSEVINFWNEKKVNFNYGVGAIDPKTNIYPYTQLVWYNSYRVGCAATYCADTDYPYFYACQYCPGGNLQSQIAKPYKKGPSCGDCPGKCDNKLCTNPCKYMDKGLECKKMKQLFSCKNAMVKKSCKATCYCKKSIV